MKKKKLNKSRAKNGIEVSDINDPRYISYQDSLKIYNNSVKAIQKFKPKTGYTFLDKEFKSGIEGNYPPQYNRGTRQVETPEGVTKIRSYQDDPNNAITVGLEEDYLPKYKKPVQPYIYKNKDMKSETITPKKDTTYQYFNNDKLDSTRIHRQMKNGGKALSGDTIPGPSLRSKKDLQNFGIAQNGTKLSKEEEKKYGQWKSTLPKNLQYEGDYDLRGFWKENPNFKPNDPKQHLTDKYKLPNHPTFSDESIYYNRNNRDSAGHWDENTYIPFNPKIKDTIKEKKYGGLIAKKGKKLTQSQLKKALDGLGIEPTEFNPNHPNRLNADQNNINYQYSPIPDAYNNITKIDNTGQPIVSPQDIGGEQLSNNIDPSQSPFNSNYNKQNPKKNKSKKSSIGSPKGSISTTDIFAGLIAGANAILPATPIKSNASVQPGAYNPYPQGIANSQATFEDGGEMAKKGFKLNPKHKGWCTPMTKATCTGKRRTFALNAKRHFKKKKGEDGMELEPILNNNELQIEDNQYKMLSPQTMELTGDSHNSGGQDIQFNQKGVEAEGGETIHLSKDGSAIVGGNMRIPGTTTKFKDGFKYLGKQEAKVDKIKDFSTTLVTNSDPKDDYDKFTFNSGRVLQDAFEQKSKAIADQKEYLTNVQNKILDLAETTGQDPKKVAKYFGGKAKYGINLKKMDGGGKVADQENPYGGTQQDDYYNMTPNTTSNNTNIIPIGEGINHSGIGNIAANKVKTANISTTSQDRNKPKLNLYKDKLGISDILPELYELGDKQQPVPVQSYSPELFTPYSVSFEDQKIDNDAAFNAAQKTLLTNPAALGALSANLYNANNRVSAEQFRQNQGIAADTYNKNIGEVNRAKEMNLKLADEANTKTASAYENTRANRLAAMTSISTKKAQERAENANIQLHQALYNFGYDPSKGFEHLGEDPKLQYRTVYITNPESTEETSTKQRLPIYGANGKITGYNEVDKKDVGKYGKKLAMGGGMSGMRGNNSPMAGMGSSEGYIQKKRKKSKSKSIA